MSRTSVRTYVQAELTDALLAREELTKVAVLDGTDTSKFKVESIVIGDSTSVETAVAYMMAGRKMRNDLFTFDVSFYAANKGQGTPAIAKARANEMFGALENILADHATFAGLHSIQINGYDGPNSYAREGGGFAGYVNAHILCNSQLT